MIIKIILTLLVILIVLICVYFFYLSISAVPPHAQLDKGTLRPCPDKPNCVSSESSLPYASIAPILYSSSDEQAWNNLIVSIQDADGTIIQKDNDFLWATFTSLVFRFVDDVEIRMDKNNKMIQIRSASRSGHSDLGVNRKRVEKIRSLFEQRQQQ